MSDEAAGRGHVGWRTAVAAAGALAVLAALWIYRTPPSPAPPVLAGRAAGFHVLLITIDTVRADHLGCYGHAAARTPTIDGLAGRGLRFDQAIAPAPLTLPSHATLLTGLVPPRHGVRNNGTFALAEEHTTLAEILRGAGYRTLAAIGAYVLDRRYGLQQGFDDYDDDCNPAGVMAHGSHYNERPAADVTNAALAQLDAAAPGPQPLLMWVHYFDAHHPYEPPQPHAERFGERPYDGEIAYVDAEIARLVAALEDRGLLERTLIVIAADHGEGLGEHDEATHSYLVYDSTVRVPVILSCPTLWPAGRVVADRVVGLVDLLPTILGLLGVAAPPGLDGLDVLAAPSDPGRAVYFETLASLLNNGWAPLHGLRRLGDKFILAPRPEYFDVSRDPGESSDLGTSPAGAVELRARLDRRLAGWSESGPAGGARPLDPRERERLASLGYVASRADDAVGQRDPKDMMLLWNRVMQADALSGAGLHDQAAGLVDGALQADPNNGRGWYVATLVHKRRGDFKRAEACVRRAVQLSPSADGYVLLAQFLLRRGEAGEPFEQALAAAGRHDPAHGGIYVARGDRLALAGRFAEALREFEKALELDPVQYGPVARQKIAQVRQRLGG